MDPLTALGAVASVAQLAATALSLSKTLYSLGAAIASASDDIQVLADDLKTFSQSLTLLSRLLEDSKSWYSDDIYLLTAKIIRDCAELYVKIDKILVKLGGNGKSTWKLRVKFVMYKEGQIRKLLNRLRDMKGTLATILMSLQVDLQLSLLNISSSSKIQRPAEKPLEPETLRTLKQAQEAVEAGAFLPKYTVHSEQVVLSSEGVELSSTRYEISSEIQCSNIVGTPSAADGKPFPTLSRGFDFDRTPFSNPFGVTQSFALLPSPDQGFPPVLARDTERTPVSTSTMCRQEDRFQNADSMNHERGISRDERHSTDAKMNDSPTRSLKSSSSTESFKSAMSIQEEDLNLARKVKAVQSVMHAFRTALEILNNVVDRRIHDKHSELYLAAKKLEDSLDNGSKAIDRKHILHFKQHGQSYLQLFTEPRSAKLQSISSNLMAEVAMKLHEYSAEHEELQKSCFEALHSSSENTCKRVLQYLNRVVHQLPVKYALGLTDTAGLRPRQRTFTSCTECRRRKQRCNQAKDRPCNNCARRYPPVICTYESSSPPPYIDRIVDLRDDQAGTQPVLTGPGPAFVPTPPSDIISDEEDSVASEVALSVEIHPQSKAWPHPNENTSPKPALPIRHHTNTPYSHRPQLSSATWKTHTTSSSLPFIGYTFKRVDDSSTGNNNFPKNYLTQIQQNPYGAYPPQNFNPQGMPMSSAPLYYPQMSQMRYMNGPPQSLQPRDQQPNIYTLGQYAPQGAQPMSRNSSQMSEQRLASRRQTPSMTSSVSHTHTPKPKANPAPSPAFSRPARKSAAIIIKRPDGEVLDVKSFKAPASPTRSQPRSSTPVIAATLTPPPKASIPQAKPSTPQHELLGRPRRQDDEYYYRRDVRDAGARRNSVSDESGSSDVVSRRIIRKERSRSQSPHHKRYLAEGALAGAGVAALLSNHRDKPGDGPEHRGRKVLGSAALGAVGAEVTTRARSRCREDQYDRSLSRSRSSSPSVKMSETKATTGFPGAVGYYRLTAEEGEEDVAATKQQIRLMKQQGVSSTRNALRIAFQAEETGRATLARLGAHGERISNNGKNLDLSSKQNFIAEQKAQELKTLNKSMFAVYVSNPFTASSRRAARVQEIIEKDRGEREQRDENQSFPDKHSEAPQFSYYNASNGKMKLEILNDFVEDQLNYVLPQIEGPADSGAQKTNLEFVGNSDEDLGDREGPREPPIKQLGGAPGGGGGNHALQDYQMQLMLLEQQNKKRLMMGRQEQNNMMPRTGGHRPTVSERSHGTKLEKMNKPLPPPQGASDREPVSTEAEMQKPEEYQKSLLTLTCGNDQRLMMARKEIPTSPSNLTDTAPQAADATTFPVESQIGIAYLGNDVFHEFEFNSFLHQDGKTMDFTFDTVAFPDPDSLAQSEKDNPKNELLAEEQTTSSTPRPAPTTSTFDEDGPLYVNKKQFHRILKRRVARQKLEEKLKSQSSRPQKRWHHSLPMRRPRGPGGQFLTQEQIAEILQGIRNELTDASSTTKQASQPDHIPSEDYQPTNNELSSLPRQTALVTTYPALSHSQLSELWWRAYISLCNTHPTPFRTVAEELRSELGLFATENLSDELICKRISTNIKRIGTALHDDKLKIDGMLEIMEMRGNVIRIMTTVELQLGLEVATLGWSCVWTFLAVHEYVFASSQCEVPEMIQMLKTSFKNLQDIVAVIARYAVMENLYHQTGSALSLSLKPEYQSSLVDLCTTVLQFFATSFELGRKLSQINIGGKHGEEELAKRCNELVNEIKKMDRECQGFRVLVDTVREESGDSGSEDVGIEDVGDEGWEVVDVGATGAYRGTGVD